MPDHRSHFANEYVAHRSVTSGIGTARQCDGLRRRVSVPVANIYRAPELGCLERQSLMGRSVTVLEERQGFAFMRDDQTGYVGYMDAADLADWVAPTHRVVAPRSFLFDGPDFKRPAPIHLSHGSLLRIAEEAGRFAKTDCGRWAIRSHIAPITPERDPVAVAERFFGTPYLWGGDSGFGIDCSGLVQASFSACGLACPGDSDQQETDLGETVQDGSVERGDLFFWKGHVAIAVDSDRLIHANAFHMAVAYEPVTEAVERIVAQGDGPVRRQARVI